MGKVKNRQNIREKNLIPFEKGKSGNPNGRPVGQRNYATIYKEALLKLAELNGKTPEQLENELIATGFAKAKNDYRFYKDVMDRIHGAATQRTDITSDGKPINSILVEFINGAKEDTNTH